MRVCERERDGYQEAINHFPPHNSLIYFKQSILTLINSLMRNNLGVHCQSKVSESLKCVRVGDKSYLRHSDLSLLLLLEYLLL